MNERIEAIKSLSKEIGILYVEDNEGLSKNMHTLLSKIFEKVYIAHDGEEGYKEYIKNRPKIVITDINMPKLNGFTMMKKIKAVEPKCKVIILSAYDEKKDLYTAINLSVFRYLHKPIKIPELMDALYDTLISINKEEDGDIFLTQLQNIFNYQNNIVIMMHNNKFILVNKRFNEFFGISNLDEFIDEYKNIDKLLLEHKEFLYSTPSSTWVDTAIENPGRLFHTKIENYKGEKRHLILKLREIPERDKHYILSFDDVTELNLMALFDLDAAKHDATSKDKMSILSLLRVIKENSSEVKIHNFYKGLTIVNPAVIVDINNENFTLKTVNTQLKIIRLAKLMTVTSEVFPKDVICKSIKNVDSDNQTIIIDDISFASRSAADRKYIRLEPDANHVSTLYYKNIKFPGDTYIMDISEVSVKLKINALPAGIEIGTKIKMFISLKLKGKPLSFSNIEASVYRIDENKRDYNIVLLYELNNKNINNLREYLAHRQIELIREFKSIDINSQIDNHYSI
ncbi:MAG: response regulator receiver protein [Sulfurimonas sp. RIFOXYD12_FULL_33_39]|uniref:response regulator transcription factor n=1 Tax=unclassified Sulfurimonas TaxID=2623549 RepID=UPI0008D56A22|nr:MULTISPECIES: response regulator [unclassified Sulfurimonas]OHE02743.1 MAG: response regulator receiver protein [Sulfurimonas sp. RIFCSPLOWO2_12_FULL_34_6]OHE09247.1 MAG: response regulator receiver protein [Sulfurimonas sp. RIFOXYD12_FULL_33_39]OHE12970.1 MAG: response regulator receiver protein [Sulfurimonas sp. RIFOXYD2_FULL_34_21]